MQITVNLDEIGGSGKELNLEPTGIIDNTNSKAVTVDYLEVGKTYLCLCYSYHNRDKILEQFTGANVLEQNTIYNRGNDSSGWRRWLIAFIIEVTAPSVTISFSEGANYNGYVFLEYN